MMRKISKNRKGQIERSFTMIMTIMIIAVVAYVGYRGAAFLVGLQSKQQITTFWNDLDSHITQYNGKGSFYNYTVILPNGNNYLCFFDVSSNVPVTNRNIPAQGNQNFADARNYWGNATSSDNNVYLSSGKTYKINSIGFPNGENYTCYSGSAFSVLINGKGNLAILS